MNVENLIESIKSHEGFSSKVYKDSLGIETVGYGFTVKDLCLSEGVASVILRILVLNLIVEIYGRFNWFYHLPLIAKEVVVEMCYQLGISGFSKFGDTIEYLQNHQWIKAADAMLDSLWATKQTPSRALELSNKLRSLTDA